jgi:hypothetical protein
MINKKVLQKKYKGQNMKARKQKKNSSREKEGLLNAERVNEDTNTHRRYIYMERRKE